MKNIVRQYIKGDRLSVWIERLRQIRLEQELTREELASHLNEQTELLYRWEKGQDLPNMEQLLKLSRLAGRPLGYLMAFDMPISNEETVLFPSELQFRSHSMLKHREQEILQTLNNIEAQLDLYKASRPDYIDMIELYLHQIDENYQRLRQLYRQQRSNNTSNSIR